MTHSEPAAGPSNAEANQEVQFVIEQTTNWIMNADTKAGLLLAALAVLVSDATGLAKLFLGHVGETAGLPVVAIALMCVAAIFLTLSVSFIVKVLVPRTAKVVVPESRFAWPWLVTQTPESLCERDTSSTAREGWAQAIALAHIAKAKFSAFRLALFFALGGGAVLLIGAVFFY